MHTLQQLYSGELKGNTHLRLSCDLTEFPDDIFSLAESLEVLDLSGNRLSSLPANFGRLTRLRIAFFSDNLFTELPAVLSDCAHLSMIGFKSNQIRSVPEAALPPATRWLILTNNQITTLPASIGNCSKLQKVALAGNRLRELPIEMARCRNLELLRISANQFQALPEWLLQLPKLSWLAFAGNPFSYEYDNSEQLPEVDWKEFELKEQLGEGASGHIYKASWTTGGIQKDVAVKVYKGEVTSDGFPDDEMKSSIAGGIHPNLVGLLGKIKGHPQKKQGLIMSLIPDSFTNLGLPPSLETCSRDTFKEGIVFTGKQIRRIAAGIASVARHLHAKGLMHGDLYAHNILVNKAAESLISDFGAASFYAVSDPLAKQIERIESRAFGCLLDDLLQRVAPEDARLTSVKALCSLRTALMQEDPELRPLFGEVVNILSGIEST